MADSPINIAAVNAQIQKHAPQAFYDSVARDTTLFNAIAKRDAIDGNAVWMVNTAAGTARQYAEGDTLGDATKNTQVQAVLPHVGFESMLMLTGHAKRRLAARSSTYVANYFANEILMKAKELAVAVESAIKGGQSTQKFEGLSAWITNTGSIAGLNRGTYTTLQSNMDTSASARPLTKASLDNVQRQISAKKGPGVNVILTTPGYAEVIGEMEGAKQRQTNDGLMQAGLVGQGSFNSLDPKAYFKTVPVLGIDGYIANVVHFLNLSPDQIYLDVLSDFEIVGPIRVKNEDADYWQFFYHCQLVCPNPGMTTGGVTNLL